jgi:hypothetical protein
MHVLRFWDVEVKNDVGRRVGKNCGWMNEDDPSRLRRASVGTQPFEQA